MHRAPRAILTLAPLGTRTEVQDLGQKPRAKPAPAGPDAGRQSQHHTLALGYRGRFHLGWTVEATQASKRSIGWAVPAVGRGAGGEDRRDGEGYGPAVTTSSTKQADAWRPAVKSDSASRAVRSGRGRPRREGEWLRAAPTAAKRATCRPAGRAERRERQAPVRVSGASRQPSPSLHHHICTLQYSPEATSPFPPLPLPRCVISSPQSSLLRPLPPTNSGHIRGSVRHSIIVISLPPIRTRSQPSSPSGNTINLPPARP